MRVIDRKNKKQGCEFKRIQEDHDHYSWTREQTEGNSIQVYVEELKSCVRACSSSTARVSPWCSKHAGTLEAWACALHFRSFGPGRAIKTMNNSTLGIMWPGHQRELTLHLQPREAQTPCAQVVPTASDKEIDKLLKIKLVAQFFSVGAILPSWALTVDFLNLNRSVEQFASSTSRQNKLRQGVDLTGSNNLTMRLGEYCKQSSPVAAKLGSEHSMYTSSMLVASLVYSSHVKLVAVLASSRFLHDITVIWLYIL